MQQAVRRWLTGAIVGVSIVTLSGCGTLFHPERKGQLSGNIDPVVAVANGVGLLFFIVPGLSRMPWISLMALFTYQVRAVRR